MLFVTHCCSGPISLQSLLKTNILSVPSIIIADALIIVSVTEGDYKLLLRFEGKLHKEAAICVTIRCRNHGRVLKKVCLLVFVKYVCVNDFVD